MGLPVEVRRDPLAVLRAVKNISAHEAHKRVDLLNSCGIVRYKARAM